MSPKDTLVRLSRVSSALSWLGLGCVGAAVALLLVLKTLPYSTVRLAPVDASEARMAPTPDFAIGPLRWPVRELREAKELQPFREALHAACGDVRGAAAATCASIALAERSPVGSPPSDFCRVDFDPLAHFERHMAGAPGHCLTRSAIVTTQLLAAGIPARVVQMVPARAKGHTLVEVWDDTMGWTVVDPSGGGLVTGAARRGSAADLLADPASVEWKAFGNASVSAPESEAKRHHFQTLLEGDLLYPEPWLYLRRGERVAPWPLRGHYARIGPLFATLGPVQLVLTWAIPALAVTGLAFVVAGWRRRHAYSRALPASREYAEVRTPGALEALPPA